MTINDFQDWYDKKESKFADSQVSYFFAIRFPINISSFPRVSWSVNGCNNNNADRLGV